MLDVGCGTGEIIVRLAAKYPQATFTGIDLEEPHLARAAERCAIYGERVRFQPVGYLYPAEDPATAQKLKQRAEVQVAAGLPITKK